MVLGVGCMVCDLLLLLLLELLLHARDVLHLVVAHGLSAYDPLFSGYEQPERGWRWGLEVRGRELG